MEKFWIIKIFQFIKELSLEFKEILEKHKEFEKEFKKSENKEEVLIKYINIIY